MIGLDSYSRQVFYLFGPHFDLCQSLNRLPIWNSQNCSMFPLASVAGWLQGHWWGFISRNYVVWPTFFLMNVFIALKGSRFWFLFILSKWLNESFEFSTCLFFVLISVTSTQNVKIKILHLIINAKCRLSTSTRNHEFALSHCAFI